MEYVLTTENLSKSYGRFQALDQLSLHVPKGSVYGLVGRNGAGKTTLIRLGLAVCRRPAAERICSTEKEAGTGSWKKSADASARIVEDSFCLSEYDRGRKSEAAISAARSPIL